MPTAAKDYGGMLAAVLNVLQSDAALTSQHASFAPSGGSPSQANSIFSGEPPKSRAFPCITLWDITVGAALKRQHDAPTKYAAMLLQIDVWGASDALRPIGWEIDNLLEPAARGGAIDTAEWQFDDIDTSGDWRMIRVPQQWLEGSEAVWQYSKVFRIRAASKN